MSDLPTLDVLGSVNVDLTVTVDRLPAPGETVGGGTSARTPGGKGANQAAAAARLGAPTRLLGAVGDDDDGRLALAALRDAGVGVDGVRVVDAPTGTAVVVVDASGENQIVVVPGANAAVTSDGLELRGDVLLAQLEVDVDAVTAAALRSEALVVVNAAPARPLPAALVARADVVVVNETEHAQLPELRDARAVAVTLGARGAVLLRDGRETGRAGAPRVDSPVSTVGAGDAFCAALALALGAGWSDDDALAAACAVGADAVRSAEAQPPLRPLASYRPGR